MPCRTIMCEIQASGFKIVHLIPKNMLAALRQYDDVVLKQGNALQTVANRPTDSVVKTISE